MIGKDASDEDDIKTDARVRANARDVMGVQKVEGGARDRTLLHPWKSSEDLEIPETTLNPQILIWGWVPPPGLTNDPGRHPLRRVARIERSQFPTDRQTNRPADRN